MLLGSIVQTSNRYSVTGWCHRGTLLLCQYQANWLVIGYRLSSEVIRARQALEQKGSSTPADILCTDEKQMSGLPCVLILLLVIRKKNIRYRWGSRHFVPKQILPEWCHYCSGKSIRDYGCNIQYRQLTQKCLYLMPCELNINKQMMEAMDNQLVLGISLHWWVFSQTVVLKWSFE